MSNRGRHKKKIKTNDLSITTVNTIYHEIENFRTQYHFCSVRLNFRQKIDCEYDSFGYDIRSKINVIELIDFLIERKKDGFNYVRIPNSNIIKDKYYEL